MKKDSEKDKNQNEGRDEKSQAPEEHKKGKYKGEQKPDEQQKPKGPVKNDDPIPKEQERFLAKLISETQHFLSLQNNSGKNEPPSDLRQDIQPLIDERDQFTPDNWIPRSSHLTRLTGLHPLNAEPDLTALFYAGF